VSNGPLMGRVDMWNHRIHLFAPVTGTNKSGSPSGGALEHPCLERFEKESLRRVHEYVFGVLALESEPSMRGLPSGTQCGYKDSGPAYYCAMNVTEDFDLAYRVVRDEDGQPWIAVEPSGSMSLTAFAGLGAELRIAVEPGISLGEARCFVGDLNRYARRATLRYTRTA
jgi:hypothetical protein